MSIIIWLVFIEKLVSGYNFFIINDQDKIVETFETVHSFINQNVNDFS